MNDPERLVLEDLTDHERQRLLAAVDPEDALLVDRIAVALRSLDDEGWRAAETPTLRFAPPGVEKAVPIWARFCVRGDAGEHRIAAPVVALGITTAMIAAFAAGYLAHDTTTEDHPRSAPGQATLRPDRHPLPSRDSDESTTIDLLGPGPVGAVPRGVVVDVDR